MAQETGGFGKVEEAFIEHETNSRPDAPTLAQGAEEA
jgi:hypothetical protein